MKARDADALASLERDHRPSLMKPDALDRTRCGRLLGSDQQHRSGPEPLLGEIRFEVDDDLPAIAVGARHAAHQEQVESVLSPHP